MTLATERNVTDNWKRNGSEHGRQIMAGDSPKTNAVVMPEEWRQKIGNQNQR